MIYAGIGSRQTPDEYLNYIQHLAYDLAKKNCMLRSGHADGADMAFEYGCEYAKGWMQIFIPWEGFNNARTDYYQSPYVIPTHWEKCKEIAAMFHPAWDKCSEPAKKLHARNVCQIGGLFLDRPVDFVICWTPDAKLTGGTATAIRIAMHENIPVYNIADEKQLNKLNSFIASLP